MDFSYSSEVAALGADVREFLTRNLTDEIREEMHRTGTVHDAELYRRMASYGWLAVSMPGGSSGRDSREQAVLFRELELADAPYHGLSISMMVIGVIDRLGSAELKARVSRMWEELRGRNSEQPGSRTDEIARA